MTGPALRLLAVTPRSATLEIACGHPWQAPAPHQIRLDGHPVLATERNVFSLNNLRPGTGHTATVDSDGYRHTLAFQTLPEAALLDVRTFGAAGDGQQDDTAFLQAAIMACPVGGTVWLTAGRWLTGPLFLKSGLRLWLDADAVLMGHPSIDRWPVLPGLLRSEDGREQCLGSWEGEAADCHAGLLTGIGIQDVQIFGRGTIDGNASFDSWWQRPKQPFRGWRPRTLFLVDSAGVAVTGVALRNSPSWTVHPLFSRDLSFADLRIQAPADSPNTDGINPESCQDVQIAGVHFDTGDDCIALKSGKISMARRRPVATERVRISNCLMDRGHGGIVIGSEMASGVRDVQVRDCLFRGTDRGVRIKTRRGRGVLAVVDGVHISDIHMEDVGTPFVINSFYWCDPDGRTLYVASRDALPVDDRTPTLANISLRRITATGTRHCAGYVLGLPERPVDGLMIDQYRVRFAARPEPGFPDMAEGIPALARAGFHISQVRRLRLNAVDIDGQTGEALQLDQVDLLP